MGIILAVTFLAGISSFTKALTGSGELPFFPAWGGWLSLAGLRRRGVGVDSNSVTLPGVPMKRVLWLALAAAVAFAQTAPTAAQIAGRFTANDLKADVSFLASDALEGRGTPSKGLDIAAEYIAAEFRRAGLEPAGDDGYFQTAAFNSVKPNMEGLELTLDIGGKTITVDRASMVIQPAAAAAMTNAPAVRVAASGHGAPAEEMKGKAVIVEGFAQANAALRAEPALLLISASGRRQSRTALRDASQPVAGVPVLAVWDAAVRDALAASKDAAVKVTAQYPRAYRGAGQACATWWACCAGRTRC